MYIMMLNYTLSDMLPVLTFRLILVFATVLRLQLTNLARQLDYGEFKPELL